jgi:hypothetical protein
MVTKVFGQPKKNWELPKTILVEQSKVAFDSTTRKNNSYPSCFGHYLKKIVANKKRGGM